MNMRIYMYPLEVTDRQTVRMQDRARILTVQEQDGVLCLWALVDPDAPLLRREILIVGTGHPVPDEVAQCYEDEFTRHPQGSGGLYIGTVQQADGALVWHVFTGRQLESIVRIFGESELYIRPALKEQSP
jgi:hypothetical protein